MLSHVSIGVKDLAKTRSFYDAALKPLGYKCVAEGSGYVYYGVKSPESGVRDPGSEASGAGQRRIGTAFLLRGAEPR